MRELTYSQPRPKRVRKPKGPTAKYRAKRKRAEAPVIRSVRAQCVERDGHCIFAPLGPACSYRSEWMHLGGKKRARTRGMKPEQRHTVEGTAMGCSFHHDEYDAGAIELAMTERGANGPMRAVYHGKVYMLTTVLRIEAFT